VTAAPRELDGARVIKYAEVTADVKPTDATRHIVGGALAGSFPALALARYTGEEGHYLFYLGDDGSVVTDTWHASLEDALTQAALEYEGLAWTSAADDDGGDIANPS
jgi:hypothetical protein